MAPFDANGWIRFMRMPGSVPRARAVITTVTLCVDVGALATSKAPLALAVESGNYSFLAPIVRIGASIASLGVLLSLLAGVSRTVFAMAGNRDLPHFLSAVHQTHKVPHKAELAVGIVVSVLLVVADTRSAIGFSSFAILVYYAIANAAAWTLKDTERIWPRWMAGLGFLACVVISLSLPQASLIGGISLFVLGATYYWLFHAPGGRIAH